jgi:hypothetical protein
MKIGKLVQRLVHHEQPAAEEPQSETHHQTEPDVRDHPKHAEPPPDLDLIEARIRRVRRPTD